MMNKIVIFTGRSSKYMGLYLIGLTYHCICYHLSAPQQSSYYQHYLVTSIGFIFPRGCLFQYLIPNLILADITASIGVGGWGWDGPQHSLGGRVEG